VKTQANDLRRLSIAIFCIIATGKDGCRCCPVVHTSRMRNSMSFRASIFSFSGSAGAAVVVVATSELLFTTPVLPALNIFSLCNNTPRVVGRRRRRPRRLVVGIFSPRGPQSTKNVRRWCLLLTMLLLLRLRCPRNHQKLVPRVLVTRPWVSSSDLEPYYINTALSRVSQGINNEVFFERRYALSSPILEEEALFLDWMRTRHRRRQRPPEPYDGGAAFSTCCCQWG